MANNQNITKAWTTVDPETGDGTSEEHAHNTTSEWVFIQITGTISTATVTPWITFVKDYLPKVAVGGITYKTTGGYALRVPQNARIDLRTTGSDGSTSLSAVMISQQPY